MYTEDELLPISALQHLAFCPRQWALIHIEQIWQENRLTAEGEVMHERAHDEDSEVRGDLRVVRGLRLRSLRLGLVGQVDVVEFHKTGHREQGVQLKGIPGLWQPFIIEYKRGKPKIGREDEVQLCAQALCLEEMLGVGISSSSFFYGQPRRRYDVALDNRLREETEDLVNLLHELTVSGRTPAADYHPGCRSCSLVNICLPKVTRGRKSVSRYLSRAVQELEDTDETPA